MIALAILATVALRPELAAFERLAGHCWVGRSPKGDPDTHCYAPMFDGKLLRDTHEVPGTPPYRGETIYRWDAASKRIAWAYFNSFGDEYRGWAVGLDGGLDFTDQAGAPVTSWRWTESGYTVTTKDRPPIRFMRK